MNPPENPTKRQHGKLSSDKIRRRIFRSTLQSTVDCFGISESDCSEGFFFVRTRVTSYCWMCWKAILLPSVVAIAELQLCVCGQIECRPTNRPTELQSAPDLWKLSANIQRAPAITENRQREREWEKPVPSIYGDGQQRTLSHSLVFHSHSHSQRHGRRHSLETPEALSLRLIIKLFSAPENATTIAERQCPDGFCDLFAHVFMLAHIHTQFIWHTNGDDINIFFLLPISCFFLCVCFFRLIFNRNISQNSIVMTKPQNW